MCMCMTSMYNIGVQVGPGISLVRSAVKLCCEDYNMLLEHAKIRNKDLEKSAPM